jgi:hypothetical protein
MVLGMRGLVALLFAIMTAVVVDFLALRVMIRIYTPRLTVYKPDRLELNLRE